MPASHSEGRSRTGCRNIQNESSNIKFSFLALVYATKHLSEPTLGFCGHGRMWRNFRACYLRLNFELILTAVYPRRILSFHVAIVVYYLFRKEQNTKGNTPPAHSIAPAGAEIRISSNSRTAEFLIISSHSVIYTGDICRKVF